MSLEASTWSPSQAARAFFGVARPLDALETARVALLPLCGPAGTETVLHSALVRNQPPLSAVDSLRGRAIGWPGEGRFLRLLGWLLGLGLLMTWLAWLVNQVSGVKTRAELGMALAYLLALYPCWRVMKASVDAQQLAAAWRLFTVSCFVSVLRHLLESSTVWQADASWRGFVQVPIVIALLLQVAGLVHLTRFFRQAGLGFRPTNLDWLLIVTLVTISAVTFEFRDRFGEANSPFALVRFLQSLSPILLAAVAVPVVILHRVSSQLAGGEWSTVLRLLLGFISLRCVLLLAGCLPNTQFVTHLFPVAAWLFAFAALRQWQILHRERFV